MSKLMAMVVLGLGVMLFAIVLTGCSDEPSPAPSVAAVSSPASTATSTPTNTPTSDASPTATNTPTPAPTATPTAAPSATPTAAPTPEPTVEVVIEHGNARAVATEIEAEESIAGAVEYEDDIDFFRFTAQAGQLYQIDVTLGTLDDSYVALLDADGWTEVENDDYGDSYASRIVWAAPESGDYFIEVGAAWGSETGTGDYTLTLALSDIQDDHANGTNGATAIQVGQSAAGKLDYRDDVDLFSFTAQAGQLYQIDVALGTLDGSVVALLDADGWTEVENDDYGDSYASRIVWAAPESGDYFIEVGAAWGSETGTGDYTLTLALSDIQDDHANGTNGATAIQVGQSAAGKLDYRDDVDLFSFTAQAGQLYQIDVALGTLDGSVVALLDADGRTEDESDDYGDSYASRIIWYAERTGDYFIEVGAAWGSNTGVGDYTLTLALSDIQDDHANGTNGATAIQVGQSAAGNLEYNGDEDFFRFTAQAGQLYQIDVALGALDDSYVALLDADGWTEDENDDYGDSYASRIIWYAERTGDYFIEVGAAWGSNTGVGDYTLTLALSDIRDDHANTIDDATAVQVGQSADGNLEYNGDVDFFSFTAQAGQVYMIDVALGTLDDSVVALLNANGWTEDENDDYGDSTASRIIWEAPSSGDYFIGVGAWHSDTGTYTLTITRVGS